MSFEEDFKEDERRLEEIYKQVLEGKQLEAKS